MRRLLVAIACLLAGCASVPELPPVADPQATWQARQARLGDLAAWELRGRLVLRAEDEGAHASLHWVRRGEAHRLSLAGPFGGGRVRVTFDAQRAELREANGNVHYDESAQGLLARTTGWWLPVEDLNFWVLGLPAPGSRARTELDARGRLRLLEQQGWRIEFLEYAVVNGYELPRRLFVRRTADAAADHGRLEARIAIEHWTLPGARVP